MKTQHLKGAFQYQQQAFQKFCKPPNIKLTSIQQFNQNENYNNQLVQLSIQQKQKNEKRKVSYQDEEEIKQQKANAIQDQIENDKSDYNMIQNPFNDRFSQIINESIQVEQDQQLNNIMNKFFNVEVPNLNKMSIAFLMEELNK